MLELDQSLAGAALGTAVGDALGLPLEGLPASRARRLFGNAVKHRFLLSRGVVSDDTEHTYLVLTALRRAPSDPKQFGKLLAGYLRWWLLAVPPGVGFATLRALTRSWLRLRRTAVWSAGNGPAMRSAVIGVFHRDRPELIEPFVRASTLITHSDPRAQTAALAVARTAAHFARRESADEALRSLPGCGKDAEWRSLVSSIAASLNEAASVSQFAASIGQADFVTGYAYHSVPVSLYAALRHPSDFEAAITEVLHAGGDADTTAAMVGAIVGAAAGPRGIPDAWREGVRDWPLTNTLLETTARSAPTPLTAPAGAPLRHLWAMPARNAVVFAIAVTHILRRWLPPY